MWSRTASRWLELLANTSVVCAIALLIGLLVGGTFGILATRTDLPRRRLILGIAALLACFPVYVTVILFFSLVPVTKYQNSALACGVFYGLAYSPLAVLILGAAFRSVDRELEDQALLDAPMRTVFWRISVPNAAWGIATFAMIVVLLVATDYTITDILMVRTFAEEVFTQYSLARSPAGPIAASLPAMVVLAAALVWVQMRYRLLGESSPWQFGESPRTLHLGRFRWPLIVVCITVGVVVIGIPLFALLRRIGSLDGFLMSVRVVSPELLVSGILGTCGATLIVLAAVGLAWTAVRTKRLRWPVCVMIVLFLAMPAPVIGIGLISLLNRPGWTGWLYDSPLVIVIGYVVRFLPFGTLLLIPAVQRIPVELEQAARIDGCGWLRVQRHVYWPNLLTNAVIVWLIIMVFCFGEIGCTVLLAPPGWGTASVRAFTLIHFGVYRDLAVLAVLSVACILIPWLALVQIVRRRLASSAHAS